jgi:hypothetical protein
MTKAERHRWQFARRFRRNAFGWRSQPAIQREREAVSEIKRVRSVRVFDEEVPIKFDREAGRLILQRA